MKTKSLILTGAFATAILSVLLLTGCRHSRTSTQVELNQSASVGQQLQDLDNAYKKGIITQQQYEELKKAIIKKND
jgi:hypothetical protein